MSGVKISFRSMFKTAALAGASLLFSSMAHAVTLHDFSWEGQVAGFSVEGSFSYDETNIPVDGVIRKDNLLSFDVSFFDPLGTLLRSYLDNHVNYSGFNFNFDTLTQTILQEGPYSAANGLDIGAWESDGAGGNTGLNLWSAPNHLHFDDWGNEFGYADGFHHHEDVAFFNHTTQALVDSGGVGADYIGNTNFALDATGARVTLVAPVPLPPAFALFAGALGLFGWVSRKKARCAPAFAPC